MRVPSRKRLVCWVNYYQSHKTRIFHNGPSPIVRVALRKKFRSEARRSNAGRSVRRVVGLLTKCETARRSGVHRFFSCQRRRARTWLQFPGRHRFFSFSFSVRARGALWATDRPFDDSAQSKGDLWEYQVECHKRLNPLSRQRKWSIWWNMRTERSYSVLPWRSQR